LDIEHEEMVALTILVVKGDPMFFSAEFAESMACPILCCDEAASARVRLASLFVTARCREAPGWDIESIGKDFEYEARQMLRGRGQGMLGNARGQTGAARLGAGRGLRPGSGLLAAKQMEA
jgi:hypothetical protein